MAAILDFVKIWDMGFCCISIDNFHAKNGKDPAHRFQKAHTFLNFSYKLLIIIPITLDFLKIWNMGFCCTIIGKFHAEIEKGPPID